jgi:hypothetical protein
MSFKEYIQEKEMTVKEEKIKTFFVLKGATRIFSSTDESKARKFYEEQQTGFRQPDWISFWVRLEEKMLG